MDKQIASLGICCLGIWLLAALFIASFVRAESFEQSVLIKNAEPEGRAICLDSAVNQKPKDIYIKGHVIVIDKSGDEKRVEDYCSGSGLQVHEMWCYEAQDGSGDFRRGNLVYDCPGGCFNGACK